MFDRTQDVRAVLPDAAPQTRLLLVERVHELSALAWLGEDLFGDENSFDSEPQGRRLVHRLSLLDEQGQAIRKVRLQREPELSWLLQGARARGWVVELRTDGGARGLRPTVSGDGPPADAARGRRAGAAPRARVRRRRGRPRCPRVRARGGARSGRRERVRRGRRSRVLRGRALRPLAAPAGRRGARAGVLWFPFRQAARLDLALSPDALHYRHVDKALGRNHVDARIAWPDLVALGGPAHPNGGLAFLRLVDTTRALRVSWRFRHAVTRVGATPGREHELHGALHELIWYYAHQRRGG